MSEKLYGTGIRLPPLDNLFSTEDERQDAKLEKIQDLPIAALHPFRGHPFSVREDEEMQTMADSVRTYGVLTPAIVRPRPGGGWELVSGHRRRRACELAGRDTMPCIVREMDDDTAVILMVDSNCQREHILPSEKAKAYKMKLEAIKRQGARHDLTSTQSVQKLSIERIASDAETSRETVRRIIRLNDLIPELLEMVDKGRLKTTPADSIAALTPEEQREFFDYLREMDCTPSLSQAQRLKAASREGVLTRKRIASIMESQGPTVKPREPQLVLPLATLEKYFPKGTTSEQMADHILKLLESRMRDRSAR